MPIVAVIPSISSVFRAGASQPTELTAQGSSRSVLPKIIAAFLVIASVWYASPCQPMRRVVSSAVFPQFHATAPTFKVSRIAAEVSAASHSQFCVRRNTSSFRVSDFGETERYNLPLATTARHSDVLGRNSSGRRYIPFRSLASTAYRQSAPHP